MNHSIDYSHKNIKLAPISPDDIEQLRHWRNETVTKFLSKIDYITKEKQEAWYQKDLENEDCYSFAIHEIEELNDLIGSVALYHFNGKSAELGRIFIGNVLAGGKGYGYIAIALSLKIAFTEFDLEEVIAYVHEENIAALTNNKKAGFRVIGKDDKNELKIRITKEEFLALGDKI